MTMPDSLLAIHHVFRLLFTDWPSFLMVVGAVICAPAMYLSAPNRRARSDGTLHSRINICGALALFLVSLALPLTSLLIRTHTISSSIALVDLVETMTTSKAYDVVCRYDHAKLREGDLDLAVARLRRPEVLWGDAKTQGVQAAPLSKDAAIPCDQSYRYVNEANRRLIRDAQEVATVFMLTILGALGAALVFIYIALVTAAGGRITMRWPSWPRRQRGEREDPQQNTAEAEQDLSARW